MKKTLALLLALLCIVSPAAALAASAWQTALSEALRGIPDGLTFGSEWYILALARTGSLTAAQKKAYAASVTDALRTGGGKLSASHTDYARVILALTAAGYDASDFAGYDLTLPLADFDATVRQGLNGPVWALIALDSGEYVIPACADASKQATRERYLSRILGRELEGGGFAFSGDSADPDMTAMALCALSRYRFRADVTAVVSRAVKKLSALQLDSGGYRSFGTENAESAAQILIALNMLGIAPDDIRFVKNGVSLPGVLLDYRTADGFAHTAGGETNGVATFQCLLALASLRCGADGKTLYGTVPAVFPDIASHTAREYVTALHRAGILNGFDDGSFRPEATMTRAQFAAIVVRALELPVKGAASPFADVSRNAWYASYVAAAAENGLIAGRSADRFDPEGTVSVVEAEIILARAAKSVGASRETPVWTADSPAITRGQIAQLVFALLRDAGRM